MTPYRRRLRGFTLIEVLVALTIVAFGLAALFTTVNQSVRTSTYLREKTLAEWIALNKITEARLALQPPADKSQSGTVEYAHQTWRWELKTFPSGVPGITRLEARSALESSPKNVWTGLAIGFFGTSIKPELNISSPYSNNPANPNPTPEGQNPGSGQPANGSQP